ncbi:hypothetical protein EAH_00045300, partial [Eimeria acervulina]
GEALLSPEGGGAAFVPKAEETKTVWLSNIDASVSQQQLQQLINKLTQGLTQLRLVKDFRGVSKGFAYADFVSAAAAAAAAAALHGQQLNERPLKALQSNPTKLLYEEKTLFISNLSKTNITETEIETALKQSLHFQGVVAVRLVNDPNTPHANKGYGYVDFESHEAAVAALQHFHNAQQQQQQQQQQQEQQQGSEASAARAEEHEHQQQQGEQQQGEQQQGEQQESSSSSSSSGGDKKGDSCMQQMLLKGKPFMLAPSIPMKNHRWIAAPVNKVRVCS